MKFFSAGKFLNCFHLEVKQKKVIFLLGEIFSPRLWVEAPKGFSTLRV